VQTLADLADKYKMDDQPKDEAEGLAQVEQWHFGAYSSSSCGLSNSDDKKMSDWSKHLLEMSLKTPLKNGKLPYTSVSPQQLTPQKDQMITFPKKAIASPKTPEERQSSSANMLKGAGNSQLQHSKSLVDIVGCDKLSKRLHHQAHVNQPKRFDVKDMFSKSQEERDEPKPDLDGTQADHVHHLQGNLRIKDATNNIVLDDLHHDQESENDKKIDLALKNYFGDSIKGLRVAKIESLIDSQHDSKKKSDHDKTCSSIFSSNLFGKSSSESASPPSKHSAAGTGPAAERSPNQEELFQDQDPKTLALICDVIDSDNKDSRENADHVPASNVQNDLNGGSNHQAIVGGTATHFNAMTLFAYQGQDESQSNFSMSSSLRQALVEDQAAACHQNIWSMDPAPEQRNPAMQKEASAGHPQMNSSALNSTLNLDVQQSVTQMQANQHGGVVFLDQDSMGQCAFENAQTIKFDEFAAEIPQQLLQYEGHCQGEINASNSSTQDNSEGQIANISACEVIPEQIQKQMSVLTQEEQQILYRLDFYCFDQAGCRMLQQMIQDGDNKGMPQSPSRRAFLDCLIHFMLPIASEVMVNQFGNYLCQRIMELAESRGLEKIVNQIIYDLVPISLNIHGTRVI